MNLLNKLSNKKKSEKIENYFDFYLNSQISNMKILISNLSTLRRRDQKRLRIETIRLILIELDRIDYLYCAFINDLNKSKINNPSNQTQIFLMEQKKKSLRQDFESLYKSFKRTALGLEDIPMKSILRKMLLVFQFNEQKSITSQNVSSF